MKGIELTTQIMTSQISNVQNTTSVISVRTPSFFGDSSKDGITDHVPEPIESELAIQVEYDMDEQGKWSPDQSVQRALRRSLTRG